LPGKGLDSGSVRIFTEGDQLYDEMCRAIEQAKTEILLESYIFALDQVGEQFFTVLNKKAVQGLEIKLHLDAVGSSSHRSGRLLKKKLHSSITLKWFHQWSWRRPWQFNVRNHRKLLIIDRRYVFLGGFNIHRQSSRKYYGEKRWRDTHMVIQSEAAENAARYFDDLWFKRRQRFDDTVRDIGFLPNLSRRCRYLLRCQLSQLINNAKSSIQVTTPYFVPDEFLIKDLIKSSCRGVKVSLLVPYRGDHPLVNALAWRYYSRLSQSNIKVFAYLPRMLHAKTIVVDSRIVVIGSANIDYRSFFVNHELVCLFVSELVAEELSDQFKLDCEVAEPVTPESSHPVRFWWLRRPMAELLKHLV
tara:strand:+ start:1816 stop:2892 length:1077 start_codon:yes stop_codon:yes gene_type:complete